MKFFNLEICKIAKFFLPLALTFLNTFLRLHTSHDLRSHNILYETWQEHLKYVILISRNSKNLLIYIVNFQIFRTSRPAVKEECFAPQTEEYKYEVEAKIKHYSKIFKFSSNFNDIRKY